MRIALTEGFQRDVRTLPEDHRQAIFEVMLGLPRGLGDPHLHAGLGIRKLHASGIWEARVGLGLRMVFTLETNLLSLLRVGRHDDIRRYLRQL